MIRNRKEEGRACTVLLHVIRKNPIHSDNSLTVINSDLKKAYVSPGIRTRPVQTECHCLTTWATAAS